MFRRKGPKWLRLKKCLAGLSFASLMWSGRAEAVVTMNLDQYVREILLNNHALQAGVKSVEAEYYSVLSAVGAQRTTLAGTGAASWVSHQGNESGYTSSSIGLVLTPRIDITGRLFNLDEQQRILGYEIARANFDNNLNSVIATAEETWWSAVLARENVRLQEEVLRQRSENHRVTMEKYRQELVPRLDIVRSEAQVVQAESLVKQAETNYQNLLANLSYLAGGLDVEPVEEELKVPAFDITPDYEDALTFRPDVRSARLTVERAKIVKRMTGYGMSPSLGVKGQWTLWSDPESTNSVPAKGEASVGLSLNIPIIDGHQTKYGVMNTDRLIQSAESSLQSLQEQTRRDIAVAMNDWKNAEAAEIDKKRQVERAEEELHITELMYTEGMGAQIDLINAQTNYLAVSTEYLSAVRDMYVALVGLRQAMGDYAPDENGTWGEALDRYGKGNKVLGEVGLKKLREWSEKAANEKETSEEPKPSWAEQVLQDSDQTPENLKEELREIYNKRGIK
ncbi:MAG: TolC family protein [Synergistaceae bacterium]|nr:TolC family protein [Synergistaceae bacterium]